ncbi:MAG: hypothetical protein ACKV19_15220 [Verrucomicrobiales bacterium]
MKTKTKRPARSSIAVFKQLLKHIPRGLMGERWREGNRRGS